MARSRWMAALLVWLLFTLSLVLCGCASVPLRGSRVPGGPNSIAVSVLPTQIRAGGSVLVSLRMEQAAQGLEWCLAFVGVDGHIDYTTDCRTSFPRRILQLPFEGIPAGKYAVTLTVRRSDGRTLTTQTPLCVADPQVSCAAPGGAESPHSFEGGPPPWSDPSSPP
jgi:hypothetical protein